MKKTLTLFFGFSALLSASFTFASSPNEPEYTPPSQTETPIRSCTGYSGQNTYKALQLKTRNPNAPMILRVTHDQSGNSQTWSLVQRDASEPGRNFPDNLVYFYDLLALDTGGIEVYRPVGELYSHYRVGPFGRFAEPVTILNIRDGLTPLNLFLSCSDLRVPRNLEDGLAH